MREGNEGVYSPLIHVKRESVKVEGGLGHHTGPRASLFNAAVVVQRWEVVLDGGERCLATKAATHTISQPLSS